MPFLHFQENTFFFDTAKLALLQFHLWVIVLSPILVLSLIKCMVLTNMAVSVGMLCRFARFISERVKSIYR